MIHELQRLGPIGFQDLAAALLLSAFGPTVQVMGSGRDGGRDLYHRGRLMWTGSDGAETELWDGYTIFQVKHRERPNGSDVSWLWSQIRGELDAWGDDDRRGDVPNHLVLITNVLLSPVRGVGGHDTILDRIASYFDDLRDGSRDIDRDHTNARLAKLHRLSRIKKWKIWDGYQVDALLTINEGVRRAFPAFLTPSDVFAHLADYTNKLPLEQLEPALKAHARMALSGEGFIYFDEAGSGDGRGLPVHEVAIDLPITYFNNDRRGTAMSYVLDLAERVLRPGLTTQTKQRHLVLTGAPGNGKTTLSRFIVQVFRAALLDGADALSDDQRAVIDGTRDAVRRMGREMPRHRRWPMRVDLAEFASEDAGDFQSTLLRRIARLISKRWDDAELTPRVLRDWLNQWPTLLVLDGLDEVTDPAIRKRVIEQVVELVNEADAQRADLLVVLTTRPTGYTEDIAPSYFERVDLDYLDPKDAVRYGTLATRVRLGNDVERIERVVQRLNAAAEDESLRNLLRTPLQVLILTIIIDSAGRLAPDRFSLFWGYYDAVFRRERDKQGGLPHILREHSQHILRLHELVGFELQVRNEAGEHSNASLQLDELKTIAREVLIDAGFRPDDRDRDLLDKIVTAATHRLVLIAPRPRGDGYGFDVRSLQELMAGMYLTSGTVAESTRRLLIAAPHPHWRHTWLYAAGRMFAGQEHQREAFVEMLEGVDEATAHLLGVSIPIAPRIALEVIDDGMARSYPKHRDRIFALAAQVLLGPSGTDFGVIVKNFVRYAQSGDGPQAEVANAIRIALSGNETAQHSARYLQSMVRTIADDSKLSVNIRALAAVKPLAGVKAAPFDPNAWTLFREEVETSPLSAAHQHEFNEVAAVLFEARESGLQTSSRLEAVRLALSSPTVAAALDVALRAVIEGSPNLSVELRDLVLPSIYRTPIGEALR